MTAATRSGATTLCLLAIVVLLIADVLGTDSKIQPQQRWSQPVEPLDAVAIHDSYPFQIIAPSETVISPSSFSYKTSVQNSIPGGQPSVDAIDDVTLHSHRKQVNGRVEDDHGLHHQPVYQQQHQVGNPSPSPSGFEWPFAQPLPIMRYWFRKADQDAYGADVTSVTESDDYTTGSSITSTGDYTTDDYGSTTDDTTYDTTGAYNDDDSPNDGDDSPNDDDNSDDDDKDKPDDDDDKKVASSDPGANDFEVEDDPPVNVPSSSFFMMCLIHLMAGICIALGADVWMVGRKRRSAPDEEAQSELLRLVARVHTARVLIEGLELGSRGRRGRCMQRAACCEPGPALVYAETTDAIYRFAPDAVLRWLDTDRKTFKLMAHELRRGAKSGDMGPNCAKRFTCDEMDRKPEGFSLLTRLFDGPDQNTSNNKTILNHVHTNVLQL